MKKILSTYLEVKELYLISQVILDKAGNIISRYQLMQLMAKRCQRFMKTLEKSFDQSQSSEYTARLKSLDDKRDEIYNGLYAYIKAYLKIGSTEQKEAAKHLYHILEPFGKGITSKSYEIETVSIQNLLKLFAETKASEALNKISAMQFVESLRAAETEFETVLEQRNANEVKEYYYPDTRDAYAKLFVDVENLLNAFDVLLAEAPDAELQNACDAINQYITDVMTTARARKTRKENQKEEENGENVETNQ